jgi:hypothetical protein
MPGADPEFYLPPQSPEQQYGWPPSERGPRGDTALTGIHDYARNDPVQFAVGSLQAGSSEQRIEQFLRDEIGFEPRTIAQIMHFARLRYIPNVR